MQRWLILALLCACKSGIASTNPDKLTKAEELTKWVMATGPTGPTNDWFAISGTAEDDVYIVGKGGRIGHFAGSGWTEQASPTTENLYAICVATPDYGMAVGASGTILFWDGTSWAQQTSPTTLDLRGVWTDGNKAFAVGESATAVGIGAGGWQIIPVDSPDNLFAIAKGSGNPFAVGTLGTITTYNGTSFVRQALSSYPKTLVAATVGPGGTFIGGVDGGVFNVGSRFASVNGLPTQFVHGITAPAGGLLFVVGWDGLLARVSGGNVLVYTDAGVTWLYGVWSSSPTDVWAVGADGMILHGPPSVDPPPAPSGTTGATF